MDSLLLVCWIDDNPKKFSIKSRSDIVDGDIRSLPFSSLSQITIQMKWNRMTCNAKVITEGTRSELTTKLKAEIEKPGQTEVSTSLTEVASTNHKKVSNKRSRLDAVLSNTLVNQNDVVEDNEFVNAEIIKLRQDLLNEKLEHASCKDELEKVRKCLDEIKAEKSDDISIGNNIIVKKSALGAFKSVSGTGNVYARNVFRHVSSVDEIVSRSLMGKKCNANRRSEFAPSVDHKKRDAVIAHSLEAFGQKPGTPLFKLSLRCETA